VHFGDGDAQSEGAQLPGGAPSKTSFSSKPTASSAAAALTLYDEHLREEG